MKTFALSLILALQLPAGNALRADPAPKLKQDLKQVGKDLGQAAHESKADFQKRMARLRADLDAEIAKLEEKVAGLDKKARKALNRKLKALRKEEKNLDRKLADLKDKSEDKWADLKDGIDKAAEHLKMACDDIAGSLKGDGKP